MALKLFRVQFFTLADHEPTHMDFDDADAAVRRFNSESGAGRAAILSARSDESSPWREQFVSHQG